jgi:hypothetical protein
MGFVFPLPLGLIGRARPVTLFRPFAKEDKKENKKDTKNEAAPDRRHHH